jgi:hypothetical protein
MIGTRSLWKRAPWRALVALILSLSKDAGMWGGTLQHPGLT